jgi:hypothetical protein
MFIIYFSRLEVLYCDKRASLPHHDNSCTCGNEMSQHLQLVNHGGVLSQHTFMSTRKNSTPKDANFCSPRFFSFFGEKLPKTSRITHMVTSNGGHPLHRHLRHSVRLSNSLFNRGTTKPTFTQWPQACTL